MRCRRGLSWACLVTAGLLTFACGGVRPEVKAALTGSLPELKREIAHAEQAGALDKARLRQLAHAVAEREIAGAQGPDAVEQLAVFRPCLPELQTALDERAVRGDE